MRSSIIKSVYKSIMFAVVLAGISVNAVQARIDVERMADAIYVAEGGSRAARPYGILSVKVANKAEARKVCIRTIRTALSTWDGKSCFFVHMGRKYCPPSVDPSGHVNWVRNTKRIYALKSK